MGDNPRPNLIPDLLEKDFDEQVVKSSVPVLVAFGTAWSKPCKVLLAALEEMSIQCAGRAKVFTVNVDDFPDLGLWHGINSVPTLIWFIEGKARARIVGTASASAILAKLDSGGAQDSQS